MPPSGGWSGRQFVKPLTALREASCLAFSLASASSDYMIHTQIDWGSASSGFFDIDEWEKEPSPDR